MYNCVQLVYLSLARLNVVYHERLRIVVMEAE